MAMHYREPHPLQERCPSVGEDLGRENNWYLAWYCIAHLFIPYTAMVNKLFPM